MRHISFFSLLAAFFWGGALVAFATDFSSTNFTDKDPVVSGGGGFSTSSTYRLWGSFSQPAIGTSTAANFGLRSGFLYFPEPSPSPTPAPTPPPSTGGAANSPEETRASIEEFIRRAALTRLPPLEPPCGRSDYNCDGEVDLRDLSIVLARPPRPAPSLLSVLFSDWTARLPIFRFGEERRATPQEFRSRPRGADERGLAQVRSAVGTTTGESPSLPKVSLKAFVGKVWRGIASTVRLIITWLVRLFSF